MSSPAFQFYPADWLADADVALMTLEEEGAYIRALCYCWREGTIPADPGVLARLLKGGSTSIASVVQARFKVCEHDASKMVHPRLEEERKKQQEWAQKSREGGLKSAEARRKNLTDGGKNAGRRVNSKGGSTVVQPNVNRPLQPNGNSSSSSSSSSSYIGEADNEQQTLPDLIYRFNAWSIASDGKPVDAIHNAGAIIQSLVETVQQQPPIVQAGKPVSADLLIPLAIDLLQKNAKPFKGLQYATATVKNTLAEWAAKGMPGAKQSRDPPARPPRTTLSGPVHSKV